jgi:small-conductance mechanosensitive channel
VTYSLANLASGADKVLNTGLLEVAGTDITLATLLVFAAIIMVTFKTSSVLQRVLAMWFRKRGVDAEGTLGVMQRLLHYTVIAVGLGVGLQTIGIKLGALFAAGAVFAVGIGFAMQNIAQNFVSGFILLLERSIKPGDVLTVDGRVVKVVRMNIRSTIVRTRDGEDLIVPNANLVQSTVTNQTLEDKRVRLRARVGVHYDSDMALVRRSLERVAEGLDWRSMAQDPQVLMLGFGASSVDWELSLWTERPWDSRRDLSRLHEAIWDGLKQDGVAIAYPQLDLHLDAPVVKALGATPRLVG